MVEMIKFIYVMIIIFFLFFVATNIEVRFKKCFQESDCKNTIYCRAPLKVKCMDNHVSYILVSHQLQRICVSPFQKTECTMADTETKLWHRKLGSTRNFVVEKGDICMSDLKIEKGRWSGRRSSQH
ncbi:uncharacterized protein LOC131617662 isoform X2 [Vicia villosa]|uniref:uncharacterized protein LOC131617662 isoform X2 n=1 Tax=Vicia villosa TaxID=3911 RepID=UPI00273A7A50|nr:uncharacterized protein LOC131617662 isoform X2 [Vicia villosa]